MVHHLEVAVRSNHPLRSEVRFGSLVGLQVQIDYFGILESEAPHQDFQVMVRNCADSLEEVRIDSFDCKPCLLLNFKGK